MISPQTDFSIQSGQLPRSPFPDNFRLADNTHRIVAFACKVQRRL